MEDSFEYYFENRELFLKYARSAPAVLGEEYHDFSELVIILGGDVHFISTEIQQKLGKGNIVLIPKGCFHQFVVTGNDYTRCILSFRRSDELAELVSSSLTKVKIIEEPDDFLRSLTERLIEAAKWNVSEAEKAVYLRSVAVMILAELKKTESGIVDENINISKTVHDAVSIINSSYTEPITVEGLAGQLCVSPSLLSHKFKNELNISVYKYVTKKRLSVARQLMESGVPITIAALKSGFSDYSCFLRAYKNQYSQIPSAKNEDFIYKQD